MICKNCGTNNGDNATFCAYCGSPLTSKNRPKNKKSPNRKNNNNKTIGAILIVASLILVVLGGYFILKGGISDNKISIDEVTLNGDYKVDGDKYVLGLNETVVITPQVKSLNDDYKLDYELEDTSAANISELDNKCSIVGLKETETNLNIYSDDKILKVVKLSFKDEVKEENQISDAENNSSNLNNNPSNNLNNNSNNSNNSSTPNNLNTNNSNNSYATQENIPTDELDMLVSYYLKGYEEAVYYGDFSEVSGYLTYNGPTYKELKKSIPSIYEKGITVALSGYEKKGTQKIADGKYKVSYVVEWIVNNKDGTRLQTESADYIIYKVGSDYKLDRMENWQILNKVYQ